MQYRLLPFVLTSLFAAVPSSAIRTLTFEPSPDGPFAYVARAPGYELAVGTRSMEFRSAEGVCRLSLRKANPQARIVAEQLLPLRSFYFIGPDPDRWRRNVPNYARLRISGIYPGIDLVLYGNGSDLEYDLEVQPGADLSRVAWELPSSCSLAPAAQGSLEIRNGAARWLHRRPVALQNNRRVEIGYVLHARNRFGFGGRYDPEQAVLIDPVVSYSSYLGERGTDVITAVALDASGIPITAGRTTSFGVNNAVLPRSNAWVLKADGFNVLLGGVGGNDTVSDIAIDAAGNVYLTGLAFSGFPATTGAFQRTNAGVGDAYVVKLSPRGDLLYSTFLGGAGGESGSAIAVDSSGNAIVAGGTSSNNFPVRNAFQAQRKPGRCGFTGLAFDCNDAFLTKLSPDGSTLLFSTYFGSSGPATTPRILDGSDEIRDIVVDPGGAIYTTGGAGGADFPAIPGGLDRTSAGTQTLFVAQFSPEGVPQFVAEVGGSGSTNSGHAIARDAAGSLYVLGVTSSSDFPTTSGVVQPTSGGGEDSVIVKIDATGTQLLWSTYLGGTLAEVSGESLRGGIALDGSGNVYVTQSTRSANFPVTPDATQARPGGDLDGYLAKLDPNATQLLFSTFLGGAAIDEANSLALDSSGDVWVAGRTTSTNFPTTADARIGTAPAQGNGFLTRFGDLAAPSGPARLTMVSAASFAGNAAPESIVSAYGRNLAPGIEVAPSTILPDTLAGVTVLILDNAGVERRALLFFVSTGQINFLVPAETAIGPARVQVQRDGQIVAEGSMQVDAVAPALFTAAASGRGTAAALALRVRADGSRDQQPIFQCPATGCVATPIDLGPDSDQVFLLLFGTGIRGRSSASAVSVTIGGEAAELLGAQAQGEFQGLDQINVRLSRRLAGRGEVNVVVTVDGRAANVVTIRVGGSATPAPAPGPVAIAPGVTLDYRVTFPETVQLPYQPIVEAPAGLLCSNVFCGMSRWTAGQIEFRATIGEAISDDTLRVTLSGRGREFFFALTDERMTNELRIRESGDRVQVDLIGQVGTIRLARRLAFPTAAEEAQTQTVTVAAGTFPDVVRTVVTLVGNGREVSGTYNTEVFLSPDAGIIRAIMRDSAGRVLYTQELIGISAAGPAPGPPIPSITSLSHSSATRGQTIADFTINGQDLTGATAVEITPSQGVTASIAQVSGTAVRAALAIAADAATGARTVAVVTPGGRSNTLPFTIEAPTVPPPTGPLAITTVRPVRSLIGRPSEVFTVTGANLTGATLSFEPSTGITVSNVQATATRITATVATSAGAAPGTRRVLATAGGAASNALNFAIYDPAASRVPVLSDLVLVSSNHSGERLEFSMQFRFVDNDGDVMREATPESTLAGLRFRFSGTRTCGWRLLPGPPFDRPGETSAQVTMTTAVAPLVDASRGMLMVSLIDNAGNESNAITVTNALWACPPPL